MNEKDFKEYYYNFLEFNGHDENIICSNNRKKDINNFYYPIIIANYNDKIIYSINPNYFEELKKIITSGKDKKEKIFDFFKQHKIDIVIQTKENYRNKGYGKAIVEKISRDLLNDNLIPIYWVNKKNIASVKLAESIKFKKESDEIIFKLNDYS